MWSEVGLVWFGLIVRYLHYIGEVVTHSPVDGHGPREEEDFCGQLSSSTGQVAALSVLY